MGQLACMVGHMQHVGRKPATKSVTQETEPDMEKQYANGSQWKMLCGGGLCLPDSGCGLRVGSCKQ